MTVYRKIVKVKSVGSRKTGDLRPAFSDDFVKLYGKGVNYAVHEYNEVEGWCVVELWCSDHAVLKPKERRTSTDLDKISTNKNVMSVLTSHPKSPKILGRLAVSGGASPEKVDRVKKELTVDGRTGNYKRITQRRTADGKKVDLYICDEG